MDNDLIQDTNLDLLQVQVAEVEYSGQAPINVDNQEHIISLDPSALSSKLDTSAFDEWTATHSAGEEYSAGEGIDITDHVISYTGDPGDATPWISGNKIITSADYMQPGEFIQVLSSFDLSGNKNHFITMKGQGYYFPTNQQLKERVGVDEYLPLSSFSSYTASIADNLENNWNYTNSAYSQSIDNYYNKLDASAFSSVSGDFYTNDNPSGFITGVDLSDYYKKNETSSKEEISSALTAIDNTISGLTGEFQEKGDYYSASNPSGFITGVDLSDYYKKNETSSKQEIGDVINEINNTITNLSGEYYPLTSNPSGYLTEHQDISDKLDVSAFTSYTADADTTEYSAGDGIDITNHVISVTAQLTGDYLTKESADTLYQPIGDYLTTADSGNFYPMTGNPSGFLTEHQSLSNYYEKNETSSKEEISAAFEALSGIDDPYELSAGDGISIVNDNTAKKTIINSTGISSKLDTTAFTAYTATAVQGFEYTGIAPIDVNNTTHQISADVWTLSARNGISILEDNVNKITTLDFNGGSGFYPMTGNPSGFLTAHQSLSNYYTKNDTSSKQQISAALTGKQDNLTFAYNSSDAISSINGSALAGGGESYDTIDLSAGEGISIVETADKVVISNNISAGSNMSFVYDSETNKIRIDGADAFPITATDGNTTWSANCKASAFTMARNTSITDIGAYGFEYRQAPSVNVSGTWYDLAILMEKFKYAIPVETVANSGMATGQNILYVVTGS